MATVKNKNVERLRKKVKVPADLCKIMHAEAKAIEASKEPREKKPVDTLCAALALVKIMLYGDEGAPPKQAEMDALADDLLTYDVLAAVLSVLPDVKFEARKDFVTLFTNVLRKERAGGKFPTVEHVVAHPTIIDSLLDGLDDGDVAFNCGAILRDALQYEDVCRAVLLGPRFAEFFQFVQCAQFDVASDAFLTLKEVLTKHKLVVAAYLEQNYAEFFEQYGKLLHSENYVTKRQSLKLLGELLLDRANFNIMTRYISDKENLKLMMNLLRAKSRNIQYEAFHVFKVFVANPNKPEAIVKILVKNKDKLLAFLAAFHNDRAKEDEQFAEERQFLLTQIQGL